MAMKDDCSPSSWLITTEKYGKIRKPLLQDSNKLTKAVRLWKGVKTWTSDLHGGEFPIFFPLCCFALTVGPSHIVVWWCWRLKLMESSSVSWPEEQGKKAPQSWIVWEELHRGESWRRGPLFLHKSQLNP